MKFNKFLIVLFFLFISNKQLMADNVYYLDFKFILNESNAGKKAQKSLKNKLEKGIEGLKNKEKNIQEEEKKLIQQKKLFQKKSIKKKYQA